MAKNDKGGSRRGNRDRDSRGGGGRGNMDGLGVTFYKQGIGGAMSSKKPGSAPAGKKKVGSTKRPASSTPTSGPRRGGAKLGTPAKPRPSLGAGPDSRMVKGMDKPSLGKGPDSRMVKGGADRPSLGKGPDSRMVKGPAKTQRRPKDRPGAARESLLRLAIKNFGEKLGRKKHAAMSKNAKPPKAKLGPRKGPNWPGM